MSAVTGVLAESLNAAEESIKRVTSVMDVVDVPTSEAQILLGHVDSVRKVLEDLEIRLRFKM